MHDMESGEAPTFDVDNEEDKSVPQSNTISLDAIPVEVLKKIVAARKGVTKLQKEGKNESQNYNYLKETQVTELIKQLIDDNGLVFLYSTRVIGHRRTPKGSQDVDIVEVRYYIADADTGKYFTGKMVGYGADTGDKGVYKAVTGAIKYILMKTFFIPTGDDPEDDSKEKKGKRNHLDTTDEPFSSGETIEL